MQPKVLQNRPTAATHSRQRARHSPCRRFFIQKIFYWLLVVCLCLPQVKLAMAETQQPAPDFALRSIDGKNFRLSEFRGEVVLLSFWAQWCGECRSALSALNEIDSKYKRAGLVMLSISIDDDAISAASTAKNLKLSFPVLMDTRKEVSPLYRLRSLPLLVLVDRDGNIDFTQAGYKRGDEQQWSDRVKVLLNR